MDNMEKRGLIAVAVSLGFLFLWSWLFSPAPPPPPETPGLEPAAESASPTTGTAVEDGSPTTGSAVDGASPATGPAASTAGPDAGAATEAEPAVVPEVAASQEEEIVVRNDLYEVTLTNRGGRVISWKLLAYTNDDGESVELVPPAARDLDRLPLSIWVPGREDLDRRADEALFQVERERTGDATGAGGETIRLRYAEPTGFEVEKTFEFTHGSYFVQARVSVRETGHQHEAWLVWGAGFGETSEAAETKSNRFRPTGQGVIDWGGSVSRYAKGKHEELTPLTGESDVLWAGMETTYFAALMIPDGATRRAALIPAEYQPPPPPGSEEKPKKVPYLEVALAPASVGDDGSNWELFVGPKKYRLLKARGDDLKAVINFGWPIVRQIAAGLFVALTWTYGWVGNYGVAIILLTIVIRVGFFPLMYRTQIKMRHTQAKMKRVTPKMKAIKERYRKQGNDLQSRQRMNDEIMALYKREGVNPLGGLGGCLPMLLQLPFLYGFYQLLNVTIELRHAPFFGWLQDLSKPDPLYITPILMGVSMLTQTRISMSAAVDPNQRRMMTMMTLVFTFFFINMPSGLVLYWLFSNMLGIVQQVLVNRRADEEIEDEKTRKGKKRPPKEGEKTRKARAASRP